MLFKLQHNFVPQFKGKMLQLPYMIVGKSAKTDDTCTIHYNKLFQLSKYVKNLIKNKGIIGQKLFYEIKANLRLQGHMSLGVM